MLNQLAAIIINGSPNWFQAFKVCHPILQCLHKHNGKGFIYISDPKYNINFLHDAMHLPNLQLMTNLTSFHIKNSARPQGLHLGRR